MTEDIQAHIQELAVVRIDGKEARIKSVDRRRKRF